MEQRCVIVGDHPVFKALAAVHVPGIYPKSKPLPSRLAYLYRPAIPYLNDAMIEIEAAGGHLYFSDMFRSGADQARAHNDWMSGRKSAYSPPPGGSMHESGRAFDLDPGDTGIGLAAVKEILAKHGWIGIADPGRSECWHHDWRGPDGEAAYQRGGYREMARFCLRAIECTRNLSGNQKDHQAVKDLQLALNAAGASPVLSIDGVYGRMTKAAVINFQLAHDLVPDGIAGPKTLTRLEASITTSGPR